MQATPDPGTRPATTEGISSTCPTVDARLRDTPHADREAQPVPLVIGARIPADMVGGLVASLDAGAAPERADLRERLCGAGQVVGQRSTG
jgi:hypothetical protein